MSYTGADGIVVRSQRTNDFVARDIGAARMSGPAHSHDLDLGGKMTEVPYLTYIALIAGLILAAVLLCARPRAGWTLGGTLALPTGVGYCSNRPVGMPGAMVLLSAGILRLRRLAPANRLYPALFCALYRDDKTILADGRADKLGNWS